MAAGPPHRHPQALRRLVGEDHLLPHVRAPSSADWLTRARPRANGGHRPAPVLTLLFGPRVEVSDTTIGLDRGRKRSLYARAGIPEYWVVNLRRRQFEIYRDPAPAAEAPFGARYQTPHVLTEAEAVTPLPAPAARIAVADLLPRP